MRKEVPLFALVLTTVLLPTAARASDDSCSTKQDDRASRALSKATNLTQMYQTSRMFSGCLESGATAEQASDDVVVQLAHHWRKSIAELKTHRADRAFISFVLRHVDATTGSDDLQSIVTKARTACPTGAKSICLKVEAAAVSALQELKRFGVGA
jgi:hypothetical protein